MKLGILVVYIVSEEYEKLFDLHLERIEEHTKVPYTIYAGVNRLLPQYRRILEQHPYVKTYELPPTDLRGFEEHSHYLEALVKLAIEDGVSHLVTLHVDSFPIRDNWTGHLITKLSETCVLATVEDINTACFLFHRDFHLKYRPAFLVTQKEQQSADFQNYVKQIKPTLHSGIGYGFKAYQNGLSWYYLHKTSRKGDRTAPAIYDDLIFHMGGSVRLSGVASTRVPRAVRKIGYERFEAFQRALYVITPTWLRLLLRSRLKRFMEIFVDETRIGWQFGEMSDARDQLLQDPAAFIEQL